MDAMWMLLKVMNVMNTKTALMLAAENGHVEIVKLLIKGGCNVNGVNLGKQNSFMLSIRTG